MPPQPDQLTKPTGNSIRGLAPLRVIRTETVLSRLPIHTLSKTGKLQIEISRKTPKGEVQFQWMVSYSAKYGPPRQLAYKLDTLVINRKLDEGGRPVPRIVRLGSLREIAQQLGLGGDTSSVRKAFRQNAFAGISAKVTYHSADGIQRWLEADFTRYSVVFAGESLPTGERADTVHLVFNEPYLEVLNHARVRPLNYDYLRELAPAAQRFYELASYRVYAALRYNRPTARLTYSDFCTFAPLQRYYDYDHFKKQMYKIHRPHLLSGYLAKVFYQDTVDHRNQPDWILLYAPGPKARLEFETFRANQPQLESSQRQTSKPARAGQIAGTTEVGQAFSLPGLPPQAAKLDPPELLIDELTERGISLLEARRLVSKVQNREQFYASLQFADEIIARRKATIENPPGFYIYAVQQGLRAPTAPPRLTDGAGKPESPQKAQPDLEISAEFPAFDRERLIAEKKAELRKQYRSAAIWSEQQLTETAEEAVRADLVRQFHLRRSKPG